MKRRVYKITFTDDGWIHGIFDTAAKAVSAGQLYCRQWETPYSFAHATFIEEVEADGRTDKEILNNYERSPYKND